MREKEREGGHGGVCVNAGPVRWREIEFVQEEEEPEEEERWGETMG